MEFRLNLSTIFILFCLTSLTTIGFTEEITAPSPESISADDANELATPSFPYVAVITADNVNIRSGPGTNYYSCGKLYEADRVKVIAAQFSWSRIAPPPGSFSWISTQYVTINQDNPAVGIVTGDNVRVYAGSENVKPMHSTTVQCKLSKNEQVQLLQEEKEDYYKIAPPTGAYLWVSTQYTNPLGPIGQIPLPAESKAKTETPALAPTNIPLESEKLKDYYDLQKKFQAERDKPIPQQNYTEIKKALAEIAAIEEAGKAARYAQFALKQIEGFELAQKVDKQLKLQDKQLQETRQRIEKAHTAKLSQFRDLGKFAAIGKFQTSNIYDLDVGLKHYRITDNSGRIVCYALPAGPAVQMNLSKFLNQKVGLVGSIKPHLQTAGALVQFTEIVLLQ